MKGESSKEQSSARVVGLPRLTLLYGTEEVWREKAISWPEGLSSGVLTFPSPGLEPQAWVLALIDTPLVLRSVGLFGARWVEWEAEARVQLWVPRAIEVPKSVIVQVEFSEGAA